MTKSRVLPNFTNEGENLRCRRRASIYMHFWMDQDIIYEIFLKNHIIREKNPNAENKSTGKNESMGWKKRAGRERKWPERRGYQRKRWHPGSSLQRAALTNSPPHQVWSCLSFPPPPLPLARSLTYCCGCKCKEGEEEEEEEEGFVFEVSKRQRRRAAAI